MLPRLCCRDPMLRVKAGRCAHGDDVELGALQHRVERSERRNAGLLAGGAGAGLISVADRDQRETFDLADRLDVKLADATAAHDSDAEVTLAGHAPVPSEVSVTAVAVIVQRLPQASHRTSPLASGSRSPHWHIQPMRRAGTPAITANGGTSRMITAPAPMKQYSPSVVPHTMVALAPIEAPRRTSVVRYSFFRDTWLRGFMTFVNTMEGPQNTSASSTTPS